MEDQNELLQCSDDESLSANEDQSPPVNNTDKVINRYPFIYNEHSKCEFFAAKILLICSTTLLVILLPLYMRAANVDGNIYSLVLTNSVFSLVAFVILLMIIKFWFLKNQTVKFLQLPIKWTQLLLLSSIYFLCGFMIIYALDRNKVICHIQDPIKGLVVVFSLFYYFVFSVNFMGLQRIFSTTAIIVGLFVAVDYGLCDEFKCRGYERNQISDDTGQWSWQVHATWTSVYIGGLALFAAYIMLLERSLLTTKEMHQETSSSTSIEDAVSNSVSNSTSNTLPLSQSTTTEATHWSTKFTAAYFAAWLHIFGLLIVVALSWVNFLPHVHKGPNTSAFLNYTVEGVLCHFNLPVLHARACHDLPMFSWLFLISYVIFVISSVKFLILTQSAVYTTATMSISLPLSTIWWSLFQMLPSQQDFLVWSPSFTGELVSSFLGLPIIIVGLYLLYSSHFKDCQRSRIATHFLQSTHRA